MGGSASLIINLHAFQNDNSVLYYMCVCTGRTDISVKTEFKPRVTLGAILSEQNLELLMGQL